MSSMPEVGVVYILMDREHSRIKVGWTGGDPENRRRAVECAAGVPLQLIGRYTATRRDEQAAHAQLAPWHILGEWFHYTPEVFAWITGDLIRAEG